MESFTSTEHHWPREVPKKTVAELEVEIKQLKLENHKLEGKCGHLQADLDDASDTLQLHQTSGDYEAGRLLGNKALENEIERLQQDYALFEEMAPPDIPRSVFVKQCFDAWEKAAEIERLQKENAGLKYRLAKTHGDTKYVAEVEAAEAGKQ